MRKFLSKGYFYARLWVEYLFSWRKIFSAGFRHNPRAQKNFETLSVESWCKKLIDHAEGFDDPDLPPLPAKTIQKIPSNTEGAKAMELGAAFYRILNNQCELGPKTRVLDFGCGWGRISRFLVRTIREENIFGVDVENSTVMAAEKSMPSATFKCVAPGEVLPFEENSFDVVFSNSVFSHLSEASYLHYINEITRCLKPGGKLLASFLDSAHLDRWVAREDSWLETIIGPGKDAIEQMKKTGFVYGHSHRIEDYGMTFISEEWIIKHLPEQLTFSSFVDNYVHNLLLAKKV